MLSVEVCLSVGSASLKALKDQRIAINLTPGIHFINPEADDAHNFQYSGKICDS